MAINGRKVNGDDISRSIEGELLSIERRNVGDLDWISRSRLNLEGYCDKAMGKRRNCETMTLQHDLV